MSRSEGPHPEGDVWLFDWALVDGSLGGWVRLATQPAHGTLSYHGAVCGSGRQLALVSILDAPVPRGGPFEIRADGAWAMHHCETPMEHWTIGAEAYAVGLDRPADAWGRAFGDRVPFGLDLEWEDEATLWDGEHGYGRGCRVTGELLIGDEAHDLDTVGSRLHHWGRDPWTTAWARLDDGTWIQGAVTEVHVDDDGLPVIAHATTEHEHLLTVEAMAVTPVVLAGGDHVARALARVSVEGTAGIGWVGTRRD